MHSHTYEANHLDLWFLGFILLPWMHVSLSLEPQKGRVFYFCLLILLVITIRKSQFNIEILISWWFLHIYSTFQAP